VDEGEKRLRMARMLELASEGSRQFRQGQIGKVRQVLWESPQGMSGLWSGLTDNYVRVRAANQSNLANRITPAELTRLDGELVLATPVLATVEPAQGT
jgi:tRNA A37 methylthiotransferase MiaB